MIIMKSETHKSTIKAGKSEGEIGTRRGKVFRLIIPLCSTWPELGENDNQPIDNVRIFFPNHSALALCLSGKN